MVIKVIVPSKQKDKSQISRRKIHNNGVRRAVTSVEIKTRVVDNNHKHYHIDVTSLFQLCTCHILKTLLWLISQYSLLLFCLPVPFLPHHDFLQQLNHFGMADGVFVAFENQNMRGRGLADLYWTTLSRVALGSHLRRLLLSGKFKLDSVSFILCSHSSGCHIKHFCWD